MDSNIKPLISVIVTAFQMEKYIVQCLDSIINQQYNNIEIIVVDDGSTDNTATIVDRYSNEFRNIIVVHKKNEGLIEARRTGAGLAIGNYLSFIDADDWIEGNFFCKIGEIIELHEPDIINVGLYREYDSFHTRSNSGIPEGMYNQDRLRCEMMQVYNKEQWHVQPFLHAMCVNVFKKTIFEAISQVARESSITNGEDTIRVGAMTLSAKSVYILHDCLYHYRMRDDSMSHRTDLRDLKSSIKMGKEMISVFKQCVEIDSIVCRYIIDMLFFSLAYMCADYLFNQSECLRCFPSVEDGSRLVLYGKGRFSNEIIRYVRHNTKCHIINSVDKNDFDSFSWKSNAFDYVLVAIISGVDIQDAVNNLIKVGVPRNRIALVDRNKLEHRYLPDELLNAYEEMISGVNNHHFCSIK